MRCRRLRATGKLPLCRWGPSAHRRTRISPLFFAKADLLVEEAGESLRHIGRLARWLWTNEPDTHRLTELLQWAFDLRCECLELAPVLACLQTPLEIWRASEGASPAPPGESPEQTGEETASQEPETPGASP